MIVINIVHRMRETLPDPAITMKGTEITRLLQTTSATRNGWTATGRIRNENSAQAIEAIANADFLTTPTEAQVAEKGAVIFIHPTTIVAQEEMKDPIPRPIASRRSVTKKRLRPPLRRCAQKMTPHQPRCHPTRIQ